MNLYLLISGIIILIVLLIVGVRNLMKQGRELTLALGSTGRKIREATRRIRELESIDPAELTENDRRNLEKLKQAINQLKTTSNGN
jgi:hypothetical protein